VRKLILALAVAGLMVVAVPTVMAAGGPRLAGTFSVVGTIHENDFNPGPIPDGTTTKDVFKFTASCKAPKACATIALDRDGGKHSHYKSTLRKTARGVYKGTEGPFPYSCPGSNNATFTAKHVIRVTKARNRRAKTIGGTSKVKILNCSFATFVNYTLKGTID
jgi:hypothetical protein